MAYYDNRNAWPWVALLVGGTLGIGLWLALEPLHVATPLDVQTADKPISERVLDPLAEAILTTPPFDGIGLPGGLVDGPETPPPYLRVTVSSGVVRNFGWQWPISCPM